MSWTELPKECGCACGLDGRCRNSNRIELSPRIGTAPTSTATSQSVAPSNASSSARTITDWWINVAVKLLRPVEKWHAWNVRRQYRKGRFGSGAVTTRSQAELDVRNRAR